MMNCCTQVGCGKRLIELAHSDQPARPQPDGLSISPATRYESRQALSPAVIQPPSLRTNILASVLAEDDDSDNENADEQAPKSSRNSVTGNLSALRTKIIRRLSQKNYSKHEPYHSIGNSEEEVARRAELKRLMRKRIERELHSEDQKRSGEPQPEAGRRSELPNGVGPRDALEFDIVNHEDAASLKHDQPDNPEQDLQIIIEAEMANKALHRRSSCPTTPLRPLSPKRSSQRLREHVSLPQIPVTLERQPDNFSDIMTKTDSFHCVLPDLVPVVFEHPQDYLPKTDEDISVEATTHGLQEQRNDLCKDHSLDVINDDLRGATSAELALPGSPINEGNIRQLECDSTSEQDMDETTPLDTWLRSQCVQSLSLCSSMTSSTASSGHLGVSCRSSSKESFDSKLHGLRLKPRPRSQHKMKLFPSQERNHDRNGQPSHRILSPNGLQTGFLQSSERYTHRSVSPPLGSSRYTTEANSRDESPKLTGQRLPGQTLQALRPRKNDTEDKSDSSSYKTAFTNQENATSSMRVITTPWWQTTIQPPTEPVSASLPLREAELHSVSARLTRVRKSSGRGQQPASKIREDLSLRKTSMGNKVPVIAKIQSLLVLKPQVKKQTTRIVSHTGVLSVTPAPELQKVPQSGFTLSPSDPDFAPRKPSILQRLLRINSPKAMRPSQNGRSRAQSQIGLLNKKENDRDPISTFSTLPGRLSADRREACPAKTGRPLPTKVFVTPTKQQPNLAGLPANETSQISIDENLMAPLAVQAVEGQQCVASENASTDPEYSQNESFPILGVANAVVIVQCSASATAGNMDTHKSQSSYEDCVPRHMLQDTDSTSNSSKLGALKRSKSDVEHRTTDRDSRPDKFRTWHGIPKGQMILLDSTLEFGAQLEQALADAKLMVAR